jgi:hypothetical protein
MSLSVRPYEPIDADSWDEFCSRSLQSTILHTRRFLSYHGERFADCSLIIEDNGKLVGLFPAALSLEDPTSVVSHPGITYGGILHHGNLRGERMVVTLVEICRHFRKRGRQNLIYKVVPTIYHRAPAQDDLYALFRLHAKRTRCDLSCTIDLQHRLPFSERRTRSLKKATHAGVMLFEGAKYLPFFWEILEKNLENKHRAKPVHNINEITLLVHKFPEQIRCTCAFLANQVVAGILVFITPTVHHAQYIASSDVGYKISALDLVLKLAIETAITQGARWFDFGISNEKQGRLLNDGLYRYKSEFGGGGVVHEFFDLDLKTSASDVA